MRADGSHCRQCENNKLEVVLARRHARGPVVGVHRPVELVDDLLDDIAGQLMNIALMPGYQEVEELSDAPRLLLHRQRRTIPTALCGEEPVRVSRLRGPHRPAKKADELEQRRPIAADAAVTDPRAYARQQVLIHQLLLVVRLGLGRPEPKRRA
ncbi:hypothetical protein ABZ793_33610 [Micromonospora sp. NPDC047465]|uniref:hypothetical protein n=1 Tax=Micromonospora sp. NPDC047465 TaxID=3154813 RepID=UPI0034030F8F